MKVTPTATVLAESFGPRDGAALWVKRLALLTAGIVAMTVSAKIRVPFWPVPATMQTFVVLAIGAAYGTRLGVATLLGYLVLGLAGVGVFTGDATGIGYLFGPTGGYLAGFVVAGAVMGRLAARGYDRSIGQMLGAMLAGTGVIFAFGLGWMAWLFAAEHGVAWVLQHGLINFLPFEAVKIALAALLFPALWRLVGSARG